MVDARLRKGTEFRDLHRAAGTFVMPNAWNAGSACMLEDAGFMAIGTTSAGIAFSMGLPDYEEVLSRDEALEETRRVAREVKPMEWKREPAADTPDEVRSRHADNRTAWNQGAQHYSESLDERIAQLAAGESNMHPVERANLARYGPLDEWCRRAVHLQCASGHDTLSLVLEGAHEVVGVDISDRHIDNAQRAATELGMPATWVRCDVLDVPSELDGSADLVYTGRGALCWNHDIGAWARVVARLLRPGGLLSLFDDHPCTLLFDEESERLQASGIDYFGHAEAVYGWPDQYIGERGKAPDEHAVKHTRLWTLAEVFQALAAAGLIVERLGEHPDEYWNGFPNLSPEARARLPMTFSLIARKDEPGTA